MDTQNPFEAQAKESAAPQEQPVTDESNNEHSFGPMISILIIVALLLFGGFYFWGSSLQDAALPNTSGDSPSFIPASTDSTSFEVFDTVTEEYSMTDEEFEALLDSPAVEASDSVLDTALDDLSDLDSLDTELEALELEL